MTQNNDKCVLEEASGLVNGDRAKLYGASDKDCHRRYKMIAGAWGAMLDVHIPARVVPLMLATMKHCRHICKPARDNLVDGAGYMGVAERCERHDLVNEVFEGAKDPILGITTHHGEPVGYHKVSPPTESLLRAGNGTK